MSYRSLLFCPDEKTARVLTQVLTELEFSVEAANEPFGAVKKLNDERFDALVVDCQSEQDATLLFKTARDSNQNHSSLSVAVVEGQAGVAKAFRMGANLVLTKPINVEQSKGTLRVARGLLRKNEQKPAAVKPQSVVKPVFQPAAPIPVANDSTRIAELPAPAQFSVAQKPEVPFSALELEPEPMPATEPAEAAVLESLPDMANEPPKQTAAPALRSGLEPIAASQSGAAAGVAPALEKSPSLGLSTGGRAPMVTNEPIVAEHRFQQASAPPTVEAPIFSSFDASTRTSSGGTKFIKLLGTLAITAGVVFGLYKLGPLQYLQRIHASHSTASSTSSEPSSSVPNSTSQAPTSPSSTVSSKPAATETPSITFPEDEISATAETDIKNDKSESIKVQELPTSNEQKPKAEPLLVKPDTGTRTTTTPQMGAPPVLVSTLNSASSALPPLAASAPALPQLAPGSVRVSQGVSQGLLFKKVAPVYPPMALQLRKEGNVDLLATVSKQGGITSVKVLGGDPMLATAAVNAVRQWKYRPYLLNGEPVEIQTQITITFKTPR